MLNLLTPVIQVHMHGQSQHKQKFHQGKVKQRLQEKHLSDQIYRMRSEKEQSRVKQRTKLMEVVGLFHCFQQIGQTTIQLYNETVPVPGNESRDRWHR